jgi:hypothetical protein
MELAAVILKAMELESSKVILNLTTATVTCAGVFTACRAWHWPERRPGAGILWHLEASHAVRSSRADYYVMIEASVQAALFGQPVRDLTVRDLIEPK